MKGLNEFEQIDENSKNEVNESMSDGRFTASRNTGVDITNPFYDDTGREYSEKLSPNAMRALKGTELGRAILAFEDIVDEVAGVYPKVMMEGEPEAGAWSCGMVAGLVSDIPSVKELIDRIMSEAEEIIASKLSKAI